LDASARLPWTPQPDALGLWHPSGRPARRLAIGRAAPSVPDLGGRFDVAIVAPDRAQATRKWLQEAVGLAASSLEADGVLWLIVPARRRGDARRIVRRAGLVPVGTVLMLQSWPRVTQLVSLAPTPVRDAAWRQLGWSSWAAGCAAAAASLRPGRALLRRAAPASALLGALHADVDPLAWLAALDGSAPCAATATISHRSDSRVAVVMRVPHGKDRPDLAVKVALDDTGIARTERERAALVAFSSAASAAGAAVPGPRAGTGPGVLATEAISGRLASYLLARDPDRMDSVATVVAAWLRRWNAATASAQSADMNLMNALLLAPVSRLAGAGVVTPPYVAAVEALAHRLEGTRVTVTAAHNDLTMANVLLDGDRIGVVDWEAATARAAPLVDLWYALADALARSTRGTHAQAVSALAGPSDARPGTPTRLLAEAARALGLMRDQELLSFHACWLHHAGNELERGTTDGPFTAVLRGLCSPLP
jgi:hypothetical protein